MTKRLIQMPTLLDVYPRKKAGLYIDIREGTFVPQIKIGTRSVAWLECEVDAMIRAIASGASKPELRALVQRLVAERQSGAPCALEKVNGPAVGIGGAQ